MYNSNRLTLCYNHLLLSYKPISMFNQKYLGYNTCEHSNK